MKKRSLVLVAVATVGAVASLGFFWSLSGSQDTLKIPGIVEIHEINLGSKVGGRVAEVFVREGEEVAAGKALLRFETPELEAQKAQLVQRLRAARAEAQKAKDGPRPQERAEAEAALAAAKARWDRIEEGWRKEEKQQAENDLAASRADLEYAKKSFARIEKLNFEVSQTEYDTARTRLITSQEKFNSAQSKVEMFKTGSREQEKREWRAEFDRAQAKVDLLREGTRAEDKEIAAAQVSELEAKLREIEVSLNEATVKAPSKVVIEVLGVRKGDLVSANQPIVRALAAEERWIKVFVPSSDLGRIKLGDTVEVTGDSYSGRRFPGTIVQIAGVSEFTPRNVQSLDERKNQVFAVKVRVDDNGEVYKSGMAAEVLLPLKGVPR